MRGNKGTFRMSENRRINASFGEVTFFVISLFVFRQLLSLSVF